MVWPGLLGYEVAAPLYISVLQVESLEATNSDSFLSISHNVKTHLHSVFSWILFGSPHYFKCSCLTHQSAQLRCSRCQSTHTQSSQSGWASPGKKGRLWSDAFVSPGGRRRISEKPEPGTKEFSSTLHIQREDERRNVETESSSVSLIPWLICRAWQTLRMS